MRERYIKSRAKERCIVRAGTCFGQGQRTTSLHRERSSAKAVYLWGLVQGRRKRGNLIHLFYRIRLPYSPDIQLSNFLKSKSFMKFKGYWIFWFYIYFGCDFRYTCVLGMGKYFIID